MFETLQDDMSMVKMLIAQFCIGREIKFYDTNSFRSETGKCVSVSYPWNVLTIVKPVGEYFDEEKKFEIKLSQISEIK